MKCKDRTLLILICEREGLQERWGVRMCGWCRVGWWNKRERMGVSAKGRMSGVVDR